MFADLFLPLDDVEPAVHRERVAALLARGYDAIASVHTATGRLSEADRSTAPPLSAAALLAASADARRTIVLRSGTATTALHVGARPTAASGVATAAAAGPSAAAGPAAAVTPQPACHLRQLSRLHFVAADAVQAAQLSSAVEVVRSYDIVSITPKTERVLHLACTSLDVDVVVLELAQRGAVKLRPPAVKAALRRGIYFEIAYAPGLRESTARRNLFCNAQALVRATRGKNILLSSSARSASEVRSPLELLHVGALLGLTRQQAQAAISLAPRAVLAHAAARRGCGGRVVEAPAMEEGAAAAGQDVEMLDLPEADDALLGAEAAPPQQKQKQPQQQPQQPQPLRQQRASSAAAARGGARKRSAANG